LLIFYWNTLFYFYKYNIQSINDLNEMIVRDTISNNLLKGNLKSDLHQIGIILLSLKLGECIDTYYPKVPTNLPPEMKNFISM
jgi:hypothetical protein